MRSNFGAVHSAPSDFGGRMGMHSNFGAVCVIRSDVQRKRPHGHSGSPGSGGGVQSDGFPTKPRLSPHLVRASADCSTAVRSDKDVPQDFLNDSGQEEHDILQERWHKCERLLGIVKEHASAKELLAASQENEDFSFLFQDEEEDMLICSGDFEIGTTLPVRTRTKS
jgi:hypothetical protein